MQLSKHIKHTNTHGDDQNDANDDCCDLLDKLCIDTILNAVRIRRKNIIVIPIVAIVCNRWLVSAFRANRNGAIYKVGTTFSTFFHYLCSFR